MNLRRACIALCCGLFSALILAQDAPSGHKQKPFPKDGGTGSATYDLDNYGTTLSWEWTFEERKDQALLEVARCTRECNGKKHEKHSGCDESCDAECKAKGDFPHYKQIGAILKDLGATGDQGPGRSHTQTLNKAFAEFGVAGKTNAAAILGQSIERLFTPKYGEEGVYNVVFKLDHWNKSPCSQSVKVVGAKQYTVTVKYALKARSEEKAADGSFKSIDGPSGTLRFLLQIPLREAPTVAGTSINCRCEVVQKPKEQGMLLPGFGRKEGEYAYVEQGGTREPLTGVLLGTFIEGILVHDMTQATITVKGGRSGKCFIPAGWELDCYEGDGQDVQLVDDLMIEALGLPYALQVNLAPTPMVQKSLRVLCLEIAKQEPTERMRFQFMPPRHDGLTRLARMSRDSLVKGPWDQVRLWIATDMATYDKMAKVFIPMPSMATYVRELYRASSAEAIPGSDAAAVSLMEPRMIFVKNHDPAALRWFLATRMRHEPQSTLRALADSRAAVEELFAGGAPKPEIAAMEAIVLALTDDARPESLRGAAQLMGDIVPSQARLDLNVTLAAARLMTQLWTPLDDATAGSILTWIEQTKPEGAAFVLINAHPNLSEAVRRRITAYVQANPIPKRGGLD